MEMQQKKSHESFWPTNFSIMNKYIFENRRSAKVILTGEKKKLSPAFSFTMANY